MLAYILNSEGRPLMPCSYARARKLLDSGSVKVVRRTPFVIKFTYGTSGYSQDVTLSVDAGSKTIGAAATANGKVVYASETTTRTDISKKMKQRASYRRTRRGKKCRYRPVRFSNRRRKEGWLTPTMRSKVQAHLREVTFVKSILPVSDTIIETASFDIHKITNPSVTTEGYQKGPQKDFYNTRQYILHRDEHICQKCSGKTKDVHLHVHHIVFRSNGGTNSPENLITLCETCHDALHAHPDAEKESLKLQKKRRNTTDATQVATIGSFLKRNLDFTETFGYETKFKRETLGLPKEHYIDAICAGLQEGQRIQLPDTIYYKACVPLGDYQQTRGQRSEETIPTGKIMGFRKFDKVLWEGQECFIKGRMSTGYAILMDISGKKIDFKPIPKLTKLKRLSARKSCLISRVNRGNKNISGSLCNPKIAVMV